MSKILIINTSSKISGAEKSLQDVLNILKKSNKIWVALPKKEGLYEELNQLFEVKVFNLFRLKKPTNIFYNLLFIFQLFNTSYQIAKFARQKKVDIIYANANHSNIYAILAKLFSGKKIVWHMRDNLNNKLLSTIMGFFSDKIICISEHLSKQIPFSKKNKVIYNGIDTKEWTQDFATTNIKKELSLEPESILIAQVGQLIPWKNHYLLIDVAKTLISKNPNIFFIILGEDTFNAFPKYNKELMDRIKNEGLEKFIFFMGYKEDIKEYLSEIDILVHLAEGEPFGRVLIEAMALEKPIVAMKNGGPAEIVANNFSGFLLEKPEPEEIAEKILQLSQNPDLRRQFGQNGRQIVEQKFSIQNLYKIQEVISSLK